MSACAHSMQIIYSQPYPGLVEIKNEFPIGGGEGLIVYSVFSSPQYTQISEFQHLSFFLYVFEISKNFLIFAQNYKYYANI